MMPTPTVVPSPLGALLTQIFRQEQSRVYGTQAQTSGPDLTERGIDLWNAVAERFAEAVRPGENTLARSLRRLADVVETHVSSPQVVLTACAEARHVLTGQPEEPLRLGIYEQQLLDLLRPHQALTDEADEDPVDTLRRLLAELADLRSRREAGGVDAGLAQEARTWLDTLSRRAWIPAHAATEAGALADRLTAAIRDAGEGSALDTKKVRRVIAEIRRRDEPLPGAEVHGRTIFACWADELEAALRSGEQAGADTDTRLAFAIETTKQALAVQARLRRVEEVRREMEAVIERYTGGDAQVLPCVALDRVRDWVARLADPAPEAEELRCDLCGRPTNSGGYVCPACASRVPPIEAEDDDAFEWPEPEERKGCCMPDRCLCPHPDHDSAECFDRQMAEDAVESFLETEKGPRTAAEWTREWRPLRSIRELQDLDLVRHILHRDEPLIVHANYGTYAFAVRTQHVSNPNEWEIFAALDRAEKEGGQ